MPIKSVQQAWHLDLALIEGSGAIVGHVSGASLRRASREVLRAAVSETGWACRPDVLPAHLGAGAAGHSGSGLTRGAEKVRYCNSRTGSWISLNNIDYRFTISYSQNSIN